jgi:hypothetical protein
MTTGSDDQTEVKLSAGEQAKKAFVEPEMSEPADVVESTRFSQIQIGANDNPADLG